MGARFQFKPPWWATLLTLLLCALFAALSAWQYQRAGERAELLERFEADAAEPVALRDSRQLAERERYELVLLRGEYRNDRSLLLENQRHQGRPGYHVWTPLEVAGGGPVVVVDRGWIPESEAPPEPAPSGMQEVRGRVDRLPRPGVRMDPPAPEGDWPRRVYYPTVALLEDQLGEEVHDGRLLLAENEAGGFHRGWDPVPFPPERHLGYAFQWAALGVALLVIFLVMNLRRRPAPGPGDER